MKIVEIGMSMRIKIESTVDGDHVQTNDQFAGSKSLTGTGTTLRKVEEN